MKSAFFSQSRKALLLGVIAAAAALILFFGAVKSTNAQQIVDKTVATVGDGVATVELITYSDLLWQLALQPDSPLSPPNSEDLNRALQMLIDLRLFALEARRLPRAAPTDAEINAEIQETVSRFSSPAEFERRLRLVGFDSVRDDNFRRIIEQRVAIEKYQDFRFRSFVIITPEDEARFYREVLVPEFRRAYPGLIVPALDQVRESINRRLTNRRVEEEIQRFLDEAKRRAEIDILFEV
jgi:hypothetical protein